MGDNGWMEDGNNDIEDGIDFDALVVKPRGQLQHERTQERLNQSSKDEGLELSGDFQDEGDEAQEMALLLLADDQKKLWAKIADDREELESTIRADLLESQRRVEQLARQFGSRVQPVAQEENPNVRLVVGAAKMLMLGCGTLFLLMFVISALFSVWMAANGYTVPR